MLARCGSSKLRQQKPSTEWTWLSRRSHIAWRADLPFKPLTPVASDCRDNKKAACQSNGWAVKSAWITQKGRTRIMTYFYVLPLGWAGLRNVWLSTKRLLPRSRERRAHLMWQLSSENPNSMIKNAAASAVSTVDANNKDPVDDDKVF